MNFKRPYWLLLYISLGCLVLGFADWMLVTPAFKGGSGLSVLIFVASYFLLAFGAVAFVSSLLWMIVASIRSPRRKY
jgi:hypothetical protein